MKLAQGQVWQQQGEHYLRIVRLERLAVEYKIVGDLQTRDGTHHTVTKKEFCRLLKGAVLLPRQGRTSNPSGAIKSVW